MLLAFLFFPVRRAFLSRWAVRRLGRRLLLRDVTMLQMSLRSLCFSEIRTFDVVETSHQRYFVEIAFDGGAYHGWQTQSNAITVQDVLDKALTTLLRQSTATVGCGRTDTGVHATQLFAHFDWMASAFPLKEREFVHRLNALLPHDIAVKRLIAVPPRAHARFDAIKRSYEYYAHLHKDPFLYGRSWLLRDTPDVSAMNEAAAILYRYEDFSCFSKSNTQVFTNNCRITHAEWQWKDNNRLVFRISANRFLRNMVRAIVGTLMEIGRGERSPDHMHTVIQSKDRAVAGTSVPACGLYLTEVEYPYVNPI